MVEHHLYLVRVKSNVAAIDLSSRAERKPSPSFVIAGKAELLSLRVSRGNVRLARARARFRDENARGLFRELFVSQRDVRHDYRKSRRNCGGGSA